MLFGVRLEFNWLDADVNRTTLIFRYDYAARRQRRWLPLVAPCFSPKFAFVVGSGIGLPTVRGDLLGTGRGSRRRSPARCGFFAAAAW